MASPLHSGRFAAFGTAYTTMSPLQAWLDAGPSAQADTKSAPLFNPASAASADAAVAAEASNSRAEEAIVGRDGSEPKPADTSSDAAASPSVEPSANLDSRAESSAAGAAPAAADTAALGAAPGAPWHDFQLADVGVAAAAASTVADAKADAPQIGRPPPDSELDWLPRPARDAGDMEPMNGNGEPWAFTPLTGNNTIDGVLWGTNWSDGSITYSDPNSTADYQAGYFATAGQPNYSIGFSQLSAAQLTVAHALLNQAVYTQLPAAAGLSVEAFTNLNITYAGSGTGVSTIRMANTSSGVVSTARVADFPGPNDHAGDVWYGGSGVNPVTGNYDYATTIHEIGHALGLKHGHQNINEFGGGAPVLPAATDSMEYSIMTYRSYVGGPTTGYTNETWGYAQTWMMYDIRALQQIYGADFTTNAGNTVYSWSPGSGNTLINGSIALQPGGNKIFATIWDGDGIDTYDLSLYVTGVNVNLTPGASSIFSFAQRADLNQFAAGFEASGNIYNALQFNGDSRSLIENAIGGSGNDTLTGNVADNTLTGNAGNDSLIGGSGFDTLIGGAGNDTLLGGFTTDTVFGDDGNDLLLVLNGEFYDNSYGGNGTDTLDHSASTYSGSTFDFEAGLITGAGINGASAVLSSIEIYLDGSGDNTIISDGNSNAYYGNGGNDYMIAEIGGETMDGGAGGVDTIDLARWGGAYIVDMSTGSSNYGGELYTNFENLVSGLGNDSITGTGGNNDIRTGAGNDTIVAGGGVDTLYGGAGDDVLLGGFTTDDVYGEDGDDILRVLDGEFYDNSYGGNGSDTLDHSASTYSGDTFDFELGLITGSHINGASAVLSSIEIYLDGSGDNTIISDGNSNAYYGNGGNDYMIAEIGGETMDGGVGGIDTIDLSRWNGAYVVDMTTGSSNYGSELYTNFENLISGGGNDIITGTAGSNVISTGDGNDTIIDLQAMGPADDDVYNGGNGIDTLVHDLNWVSTVTFDLTAGFAMLNGSNRDQLISIENLTVGGSATVIGSAVANVLTVNGTGANVINGLAGNDTIDAGDGNDTIDGGAGNDTINAGDGDDIIIDTTHVRDERRLSSTAAPASTRWCTT